jgi:hypothetical protein
MFRQRVTSPAFGDKKEGTEIRKAKKEVDKTW